MLNFRLFGKSRNVAEVSKAGSVHVIDGEDLHVSTLKIEPLYDYFVNSAGSNQMAITTGTSASPVKFFIRNRAGYFRSITHMLFKVQGASALLNEFGTGTALGNGVQVFTHYNTGFKQLGFDIKSNYDVKEFCLHEPTYGDGATFGIVQNAIGVDELIFGMLDLRRFFGSNGFVIPPRLDYRIEIHIRDNTLTGKASNFQCRAIGRDILDES